MSVNAATTGISKHSEWSWSRLGTWMVRGLVIAGALAGAGWLVHEQQQSNDASATLSVQGPGTQALANNGTTLLVRAYTVQDPSGDSLSRPSLPGTLQARYRSQLGFRLGGKIIERHVEVGQRVTQGQVLFRLDPEDSDLQLQVAESDLVAASSQLQLVEVEARRLAELKRTNSISQSDFDVAVSARETAQARLDASENRLLLARNQREYCDLTADQDGLVTLLNAEIGQVVAPGQAVLQWIQGDELEVVVSIPESLLSQVAEHEVEIRFWSLPGQTVPGLLREVSPIADPDTRTFDARFQLQRKIPNLAVGLTATVHLMHRGDDGIRIPMGAIATDGTQPHVWRILADGHVESVPVEILKYESEGAMVRAQLAPNDRIVSAGVQRVDSQCLVRVWYDHR
jgi:membrane fusion protein, multidrug efflux system